MTRRCADAEIRHPSRRSVAIGGGMALAGMFRPPQARAQGIWPDPTDPATTIEDVKKAVARVFGVPSVPCGDLQAAIEARTVTLFDVRAEEEFAVSRIAGSLRVDPDMMADAALAFVLGEAAGLTPAFVCSVGIRSAKLLHSLDWDLVPAAPGEAICLAGGLFGWLQEGRPLVDAEGRATQAMHPKDAAWGRLLARMTGTG